MTAESPLQRVPISLLDFVFRVVNGTLADTFDQEIDDVKALVEMYGIPASQRGILFVDVQAPAVGAEEAGTRQVRAAAVGVVTLPNPEATYDDSVMLYQLKDLKPQMFQIHLEDGYTAQQRTADRIRMLRHMANEATSKQTTYIGFLELENQKAETLTFMALEGDNAAFRREYNIAANPQ